jgi:hypothetical protein
MKKMLTLIAGFAIAITVMAADRRPMLTINNQTNYTISIDGQYFNGGYNSIPMDRLSGYRHTVRVYEVNRGFFGRRERLIATTYFQSGRDDMSIFVDRFGNVTVRENGFRNDNRYNDRNDRYDRNNGCNNENDRDWNRRDDRRGNNDIFDKRDHNRRKSW